MPRVVRNKNGMLHWMCSRKIAYISVTWLQSQTYGTLRAYAQVTDLDDGHIQ